MSTVVVPVIIQTPATKTLSFEALTPAGRKMAIEVTAAVDIQEEALLADVRAAFKEAHLVRPAAPGEMSRGMGMFLMVVL